MQGSSLGYHAYSLRVDNISNQWLQEESTLVWIPPYSLGVVVRLWGTSVALLIPAAPVGQAQQAPISGEYAVAVFSDEMRAENPGVPVRQFTLVQAVSDLTEGPQPAFPPVGVDRIWADSSGRIHHLHSDGTDLILVDPAQTGVVTSGMILDGTIQAVDMAAGAAAGNVGALGGGLTGTLPNPGLASASVGIAQIASPLLARYTFAMPGNTNLTQTTWQTIAQGSMADGIYLVIAQFVIQNNGAQAWNCAVAIADISNNYWAVGNVIIPPSAQQMATLVGYTVQLGGPQTPQLRTYSQAPTGTLIAIATDWTGHSGATSFTSLRLA